MIDRHMLYNILYALAARSGREEVLFGTCQPLAREALAHSLAGNTFPELWFEVPLSGAPWFDLHALVAREDLSPDMAFDPETTGGYPDVFAWFAGARDVRQLALSYDLSTGGVNSPAVQLLVSRANHAVTCAFLQAAGRPDAERPYRSFVDRMPRDWFACYTGVFPGRAQKTLRVECIPTSELQEAYAQDATLLERHLRQAGLAELGDTLVERCQLLARTPFQLEFQFDIRPDGSAGDTFSASVRFDAPGSERERLPYRADGVGGQLMQQVQAWGLADERWRLLEDATFAQRVAFHGESLLIYCYLAFLKLRWRDGAPVDAKVYFKAGVS